MNKKNFKKLFLEIALILEIIIFSFTYLFGKNGLIYLNQIAKENKQVKDQINALKNEIDQLQNEINQWQTDDFYREKFARENLQLSKKNEQIYYID